MSHRLLLPLTQSPFPSAHRRFVEGALRPCRPWGPASAFPILIPQCPMDTQHRGPLCKATPGRAWGMEMGMDVRREIG